MSKRFTDTDKWKDEWFMSLSKEGKLTFIFLIDNCDNAGFFELNSRINSFLIGITHDEYLLAIEELNRGLIKAKSGTKYFIKNFLFHQKNLPLNVENNAHKQIIGIIKSNLELFSFDFNKLGANEGLFSPIGKGKGKGKGRGNGIDKVKVEVMVKVEPEFKEIIDKWIFYKKKRKESYVSEESLQECINSLKKLANNNPETALKIVNQSMANNWAGLFELKKTNNHGTNQQNSGSTGVIEKHKDFGNI